MRDLIDPSLSDEYNPEEMDRVIMTASLCIEQSPILRPRMNQASDYSEIALLETPIVNARESFASALTLL